MLLQVCITTPDLESVLQIFKKFNYSWWGGVAVVGSGKGVCASQRMLVEIRRQRLRAVLALCSEDTIQVIRLAQQVFLPTKPSYQPLESVLSRWSQRSTDFSSCLTLLICKQHNQHVVYHELTNS
ncbi:hypothetical protein LEMLEM_LOCUS9875 [Lemmus lemmus]